MVEVTSVWTNTHSLQLHDASFRALDASVKLVPADALSIETSDIGISRSVITELSRPIGDKTTDLGGLGWWGGGVVWAPARVFHRHSG